MTHQTCERSTKWIKDVEPDKMDEYCSRKDRMNDTWAVPRHPNSQSERFYAEEWVNICEKDQNGYQLACSLYDNMKSIPYCYPTRTIDNDTGKISKDLTNEEVNRICGKKIIRSINVPLDIIVVIEYAKKQLTKGYTRVAYANKEDFSIPEKDLTSETLFLWREWMNRHGPKTIRNNGNYYLNYVKWFHHRLDGKKQASGAMEWLLKGGDFAYIWLQSNEVKDKIAEKYKD